MKRQSTLCATLLALGVGGLGTASAQSYYYVGPRPPAYVGPRMYDPGMPPREITAIVRAAGLAPLTQPVRRGSRTYVLVAASRAGEMQVVVDAYTGDIIRARPMVAMGPYDAPVAAYPRDPRPGAYGPSGRFNAGAAPVPPRSVPNARLANAPTAMTPPTAKPHAPLPRPRPSVAAAPAVPPPAVTPAQPQAAPAPVVKEERAKPEPPTMAPVTPLD